MSASLLAGKKGVILGVANKKSIAWSCAESMANAGARIFFSYQNERLKDNVDKLIADLPANAGSAECDVANDASTASFFEAAAKALDGDLDFLVHAIAFAKREELSGRFSDVSRDGFALAHDISAYSMALVSRHARVLMPRGGSIVTLTYLGAERVVPNYNVMGAAKASLEATVRYLAADLGQDNIRVNGISAGPINTLAARGISGFTDMMGKFRAVAPLRRNTDPAEVGDAALFLVSDLGRGITGEILHVDCGYHAVGMV
jgi:enoyl-[acyl-carrier protein] reductase I